MANLTTNLVLYNNKSAENVVHKNKTIIRTLTGEVKENVGVEHVVLTVPFFEEFNNVNYAFLELFGRYYFATLEILTGDLIKITLESDALSTFWNNYSFSQCIARRSSSAVDYRIADERLLKLTKPHIVYRRTNLALTPSTSNNYVLTLTGK